MIGHAQPAAEVEPRQGQARGPQLQRHGPQRPEGSFQRLQCRDLAADVAGQTDRRHMRRQAGAEVEGVRLIRRHAELVGRPAGGDPRMAARADGGVHTDGDFRGRAFRGRHSDQPVQLDRAFDIDLTHPDLDGEGQFGVGLAHAGEDDAVRRNAGLQRPPDLALGHRIGAAAEPGEGGQDRQVGVRFHGEGDQGFAQGRPVSGDRVSQQAVVPRQGRGGIDIGGRADRVGKRLQRHALGLKRAVDPVEMMQGRP